MSACGQGRQWQLSLLLLQETPAADEVSYAACISSCLGGQWPVALALLAQGPPDAVALAAAQHVLVAAGRWRQALGLMAWPQVALGASNFNVAMSGCHLAGEIDYVSCSINL